MIKIAMVCLGNICRSPMAEHVLRGKAEAAGLEIEVVSGGTGGWHVGKAADPRTAAILDANGYTSAHFAQRFNSEWFDFFDLIAVMDRDNLRDVREMAPDEASRAKVHLLRSFDPAAPRDAEIPDPYYGGEREFQKVLELVEAACDGMIDWIRVNQ